MGRGSPCKCREVQGGVARRVPAGWSGKGGCREYIWRGRMVMKGPGAKLMSLELVPQAAGPQRGFKLTNNVIGGMCIEGRFLERADSTVVATGGIKGDSKAVWGRPVEPSDG